jgi:hypothetical protein
MADPPPGPQPASRVPLLVDKLTDGVVDAAYTAIVAADEAAARVQAAFEPVRRAADWALFNPVRSEASQLLERGQTFRRAAALSAKAAGRSSWAPVAGSATSNWVTGGVVHAPNQRSNGLWHIQALPSDEDTTRGAWLTRVKLQQARLTESSQSALQGAFGDASAALRAVLAAAEREAQSEVGRAQEALDRRLAQSNAALALRLAQVDARRTELQAQAVEGARQELQDAGVAQPSAQQLAWHILLRLGLGPHRGASTGAAERPCHADEVEAALAASGFPAAMLGRSSPRQHSIPPESDQPTPAPVDAAQRLRDEARSRVEALSRQAREQAERDASSARERFRVSETAGSAAAGLVSTPSALARPADAPLAALAPPPVAVRVDAARTPGSPLGAASPVFDVTLGAASAQSFSYTDDAPAMAPALPDGPLAVKLASEGPRKTGARKR